MSELLRIIGIECKDDREIQGITCNSKEVKKNWIFVAIEGKVQSGTKFKQEVTQKGGIILSEKEGFDYQVENAREAYAYLLHAYHDQPSMKLKVIGITGTNGKSTTATLLKELLENQGRACVLIGTEGIQYPDFHVETNNTTPYSESIVQVMNTCIKEKIDYLIMEISSMAMKQHRCTGVNLDVLIYTNIAKDHVDEHGSLLDYLNCKKAAMNLLKSNGIIIYNHDDPMLFEFVQTSRNYKISYGQSSGQFQISQIQEKKEGTSFLINHHSVSIPLISKVNAYNFTAAIAAGFALDLNWKAMFETASKVHGASGRFEKVEGPMEIYVDYAHTEKAMEVVLKTFVQQKTHHLIVVFGCGGQRDREKRWKMGELACQYGDQVILTNDNPRNEDPESIIRDIQKGCNGKEIVIFNRVEAIKKAMNSYQNGDIIVLVGRGAEKIQKTKTAGLSLSDREIVLSILNGEDF